MDTLTAFEQKYRILRQHLDEYALRLCAAADAVTLGRGGVTLVAKASGLSRTTIYSGMKELTARDGVSADSQHESQRRVRQPGGGRKQLTQSDSHLLNDLDCLVEPLTRGDPESPLRWTCKSTTKLAKELQHQGHAISQRSVWTLLDQLGYSLQSNRKTLEGSDHPDRDAQFQHIANQVKHFQERGQPVISVDTKKKELIGRYQNSGREWQKKGEPEPVNVHDFANQALGKVIPYGVYDVTRNKGWVSIGITHDTAEFAVATIRHWWLQVGKPAYPKATALLITADGGGSNGSRIRLWKRELQRLADDLGITIKVCHFPPGTSKWNKIEHRMFSYISANWRARPLTSRAVVVNLIANTTTDAGLEIEATLDESQYETGIKVSDEEMKALAIVPSEFHGEWNYQIQCRNA
jgi:transposase